MLTSLYYYNNYRTEFKSNKVTNGKVKVKLNVAYNKDVVNNINELSKGINDLNVSIRRVSNTLDGRRGNSEKYIRKIKEQVEDFVNSYNESKKNIEGNSSYLKNYYNNMEKQIIENESGLKKIGITFNDGKLTFDSETFDAIDKKSKVSETRALISNMMESGSNILKLPLYKHMEYKEFKYYFTYNLENIYKTNTRLVETGQILDVEI